MKIFNRRKDSYTDINQNSVDAFHSDHYLRHNARRLEHLASLRIPTSGKTVLEVGAGIGDHTHYYLDRNCEVTITEAREENLQVLRRRYPDQKIHSLDMETPKPIEGGGGGFQIVHCYGLLYHLSNPSEALDFLSLNTTEILLLETCVSFGNDSSINLVDEELGDVTQAYSGKGCRPTRPWLMAKLKELFDYVYLPLTQPNHPEFPVDWRDHTMHQPSLKRAVFIASRAELTNDSLTNGLPLLQERHP